MKTEVEIGVLPPQGKEHQGSPETPDARRDEAGEPSLSLWREHDLADTLMFNF